MGDPRRIGQKYSKPRHPWQLQRLEEERVLVKDYGLKNKKEIWKLKSMLKRFTDQASHLIAATGTQADKEKQQLFQRLQRLGLLGTQPQLDNVLDLTLTSFLDRRLQTIVFRKGLARTALQARQFIGHRHILVNGQAVTIPSYLVLTSEEPTITFLPTTSLAQETHAERVPIIRKKKKRVPQEEDPRGRRGDQRGGQRRDNKAGGRPAGPGQNRKREAPRGGKR